MMIQIHARLISALLRRNGFNPSSSQGSKRWPGLHVKQVGDTVTIRVWQDILLDEATPDDRETLAEIDEFLTSKGYETIPSRDPHYLHVSGKKA